MINKQMALNGLKAAGAISIANLLILGIMALIGFNSFPVDPDGVEMPAIMFAVMMVITGGLMPGLLGSIVWNQFDTRWPDKAMLLFAGLAFLMATLISIPAANPNAPTGDALVLTTVVHYTTAALGAWFIPFFAKR